MRPKTNTAFWNKKLEENRVRDVRVSEELENQNWKVIRFWEHQIMGGLDTVVDAVLKEVSE